MLDLEDLGVTLQPERLAQDGARRRRVILAPFVFVQRHDLQIFSLLSRPALKKESRAF